MQSPAALSAFRKMTGRGLRREEDGQDLLEYGLLMALIAIVAISAVATVGNTIAGVFWASIANNF